MSTYTMGGRYDEAQIGSVRESGEKHGPWMRGKGALKQVHFSSLPIREQYRARTPRDAVLALVQLLTHDAVALYLWTEAV